MASGSVFKGNVLRSNCAKRNPVNQLYQKGIFDARPDSNVHRCKVGV